eukprot:6478614-Amphidinium_carterae.1
MLLQAVRLGWRITGSGTVVVNEQEYGALNTGTTTLNRLVRMSTAQWLLLYGTGGKQVLGPAVHSVRKLLTSLDSQRAACLQLVLTGGAWTAAKLHKRKLSPTACCTWCGQYGDWRHRVAECPAYSRERAEVKKWGWAEWREMQVDPHADPIRMLPSAQRFERHPVWPGECEKHWIYTDGDAHVICTDGSAVRPTCAVTRRASWAYVAYSDSGALLAMGFGLVPCIPGGAQTVFEGELYAVRQALVHVWKRAPDVSLVTDNQAVVRGFTALQQGLRTQKILLPWWRDIDGLNIMAIGIRKIPSHQHKPPNGCPWLHWWGNQLADRLAERAFPFWGSVAASDDKLTQQLRGLHELWRFVAELGVAQMEGRTD